MTLKHKRQLDVDHYIQFKLKFMDNILDLIWRQWQCFGVGGQVVCQEPHTVLDPEALLIATWTFGRYDNRLFDEVLRWCCYWGDSIDISRLSALLKNINDDDCLRIAGAFAQTVCKVGGLQRWNSLAKKNKPEHDSFIVFSIPKGIQEGNFHGQGDPIFETYGVLKGPFALRSNPVPHFHPPTPEGFRFLARRIFGAGIRAELFVLLLSHNELMLRELQQQSGFTSRGIQNVLQEWEDTGLLQTRERAEAGKKSPIKAYTIQWERWGPSFFPSHQTDQPSFLNWWQVYQSLFPMLDELKRLQEKSLSGYKVRSCLDSATKNSHSRINQTELFPVPRPLTHVNDSDFFPLLHEYWNQIFFSLETYAKKRGSYLFLNSPALHYPIVHNLPWHLSLEELKQAFGNQWYEINAKGPFVPPLPPDKYLPFWVVDEKYIDKETYEIKPDHLSLLKEKDTFWLAPQSLSLDTREGNIFWYDQAFLNLSEKRARPSVVHQREVDPSPPYTNERVQSLLFTPKRFEESVVLTEKAILLFDDGPTLFQIDSVEEDDNHQMKLRVSKIQAPKRD